MKVQSAVVEAPDVALFDNLIDAMLYMEWNFSGEYYWVCTSDRPYRVPSTYDEEYIDIFYND